MKEDEDLEMNHQIPIIHQPSLLISSVAVVAYVALFSSQAILIQASSSKNGTFNYNTFAVIVIIEVFKAIFSACLHFCSLWKNSSFNDELFATFFQSFKDTFKTSVVMIVPSFIYALYNNILFFNVGHFGPGVYKVLMNSRIIMIALLSYFILKKNLDFQKWVSCFLLTFGCCFVEISQFKDGYGLSIFHVTILFQAFLSSIGSISNEFVLKTQKEVPLNLQNFWMYFYGIILNSLFLFISVYIFQSSPSVKIFQSLAWILGNPFSMLIVLNWCIAGVLTSYILKYLSSITKSFATAFEMIVVVASSSIFFGKEVSIFFFIGSLIVVVSIFMYNSNNEIPSLKLNLFISSLLLFIVSLSILIVIRTGKSGDQSKQWKEIWENKGNSQSDSLHHSGGFNFISKEQYDLMIKTLVSPIKVKKNAKIIEFGVGSGAFLSSLLKVFPHIHSPSGLDYSKPLIVIAKKNFPQASFFVSDIRKVDFLLDQSYDNVFTFSVTHYLNSEQDIKLFFSEMYRVCKNGGSIFIGDVNDFDKKELAQKVRKSSHKDQKKFSNFNPTQMYVKKSTVKEYFESLGVKSVRILDESNIGIDFYSNSKYRYSVYVEK